MKNICLTWIDSIDLKRFAEDPKGSGTLIAFLKSEYSKNINELHVLSTKNYKYVEHKERFFKNVEAKFSKVTKINFMNLIFLPVILPAYSVRLSELFVILKKNQLLYLTGTFMSAPARRK